MRITFARTKPVTDYSQSIDRDRIEGEFADILQTMQPSKSLSDMIRAMFKKAWHAQSARAEEQSRHYQTELADTEKEINQLLDRIVDASSPRVVQAYEKRIDELEDKKLLLEEKSTKTAAPRHSFEEMLELSLTFLANPYKLWVTGRFELRRLVLKLVFTDKLRYLKNEGYRTPQTAQVSALFSQFCMDKIKMVHLTRFELVASAFGGQRSIQLSYRCILTHRCSAYSQARYHCSRK